MVGAAPRAVGRLAVACALFALVTHGAVAASDDADDAGLARPVVEEPEGTSPSYQPVTIARPVGRVRLAEVGDELGVRRFEARSAGSAGTTIFFSERPLRKRAGFSGVASIPAGMPLARTRLTSQFGYRVHPLSGRYQSHAGIDLAAPMGSPVTATGDGQVNAAGWMGGYGLAVRIDHGGEIETRYAHLSALAVVAGQTVKRGQVLGYVGSTGRSTGPHLHYEVRVSNVAIDPLDGAKPGS